MRLPRPTQEQAEAEVEVLVAEGEMAGQEEDDDEDKEDKADEADEEGGCRSCLVAQHEGAQQLMVDMVARTWQRP